MKISFVTTWAVWALPLCLAYCDEFQYADIQVGPFSLVFDWS